MGIRFQCENCQRKLNIKSHLAGKRGICPHCDARFRIPTESTWEPKSKPTATSPAPGSTAPEQAEIEDAPSEDAVPEAKEHASTLQEAISNTGQSGEVPPRKTRDSDAAGFSNSSAVLPSTEQSSPSSQPSSKTPFEADLSETGDARRVESDAATSKQPETDSHDSSQAESALEIDREEPLASRITIPRKSTLSPTPASAPSTASDKESNQAEDATESPSPMRSPSEPLEAADASHKTVVDSPSGTASIDDPIDMGSFVNQRFEDWDADQLSIDEADADRRTEDTQLHATTAPADPPPAYVSEQDSAASDPAELNPGRDESFPESLARAPEEREVSDSDSEDSSFDSSGKYEYLPTKSTIVGRLNSPLRDSADEQQAPPVPGAVDPIDEAPEKVWYVRPPSGGQFGPAAGHVMRRWLEEGRVSSQAIVWREGWDDWLPATQVFPELKPATESESTSPTETPPEALPGKPLTEPRMVDESTTKILAYKKKRARSTGCAVAAIVLLSLLVIGLAALLFVIVFLR